MRTEGGTVKDLLTLTDLSCGRHRSTAGRASRWLAALLLGMNLVGCAVLNPPSRSATAPGPCRAEQNEIARLQQLLAEKETLIRSQQAHQQEQTQELQASTSQATRAQVKLRRMATQTDAASTLAEVEVAMASLLSAGNTHSQRRMQTQAQRLLDAAATAYAKGDYAKTVDRATQSREIIGMVQDQRAGRATRTQRVTITFEAPVPLRTRTDCNLRQLPSGRAMKITVLKQNTSLMALAYRGTWLHIQTATGQTGWVLGSLLEARTDAME